MLLTAGSLLLIIKYLIFEVSVLTNSTLNLYTLLREPFDYYWNRSKSFTDQKVVQLKEKIKFFPNKAYMHNFDKFCNYIESLFHKLCFLWLKVSQNIENIKSLLLEVALESSKLACVHYNKSVDTRTALFKWKDF